MSPHRVPSVICHLLMNSRVYGIWYIGTCIPGQMFAWIPWPRFWSLLMRFLQSAMLQNEMSILVVWRTRNTARPVEWICWSPPTPISTFYIYLTSPRQIIPTGYCHVNGALGEPRHWFTLSNPLNSILDGHIINGNRMILFTHMLCWLYVLVACLYQLDSRLVVIFTLPSTISSPF